jgi:DNA-binding MarR family transcriptional regulator
MMSALPEERFAELIKRITEIPLAYLPEDIELSRSAIPLLMCVSRSPGCGVLDIAKGLRLSPPTISVGIHRLVKDGWLERRRDPSDHRVRPLYLTAKGKDMIDHIKHHRNDTVRLFLAGLTADEQKQFFFLMEKAINAMADSMNAKGDRDSGQLP